jgi:acyl carrier protein
MSQPAVPDRGDVIAMLATFGDRDADAVAEGIGSLELTWLITKVEERYDVTLDLSDEAMHQMSTVSGAVAVLHDVLAGSGHG